MIVCSRILWDIVAVLDENLEALEAAKKASDLARKGPLAGLASVGDGLGTFYKVLLLVAAGIIGLFVLKLLYNLFFGWIPNAIYQRKYKKEQEERLTPFQMLKRAGEMESRGMTREAAEMYLQGGDVKSAAKSFEKAGESNHATSILEKDGLYTDAATIHARLGRNREAARCFTLDGHYKEAAEYMLKAGDITEAAKNFEQIGETERAAGLYEKQGLLQKASDLFAQCGRKDRQAVVLDALVRKSRDTELIQKADIEKALEECNRFSSAANIYLKKGDFVRAIVDLVRGGELDKAVEVYSRIHEKPSDEILKAVDMTHKDVAIKFAQFFSKVRDQKTAARIFDNIGRYKEAGALAEQYGDYYYAGQMYQLAGDIALAALAMERAKSWTEAAGCYEETGNQAKAADMYYMAGKYDTALPIYRKLGNKEKTLLCCKAMNSRSAGEEIEAAASEACEIPSTSPSPAHKIRDSVVGLETLAPLSRVKLASNLTPEELRTLHMYSHRKDFINGAVIIKGGTKSEALYMIASGRVEVFRINEGNKVVLTSLGAGEHFGEISTMFDRPATATVAACEDTVLLCVSKNDVRTLLVSNPVLGLKLCNVFLKVLSDRLAKTNELVDAIQLETEEV